MNRFLPLVAGAAFVAAPFLFSGPSGGGIYEVWAPSKTGITWRHDNALSPRRYQPESIGPGVAIFDYNNDGRMDLFFPNSGPCDFFQPSKPLPAGLYRNNGGGIVTDQPETAGRPNSGD